MPSPAPQTPGAAVSAAAAYFPLLGEGEEAPVVASSCAFPAPTGHPAAIGQECAAASAAAVSALVTPVACVPSPGRSVSWIVGAAAAAAATSAAKARVGNEREANDLELVSR